MLKLVFKMLKLVLKTPKLLSPAFSLQGLGWIPHKKSLYKRHQYAGVRVSLCLVAHSKVKKQTGKYCVRDQTFDECFGNGAKFRGVRRRIVGGRCIIRRSLIEAAATSHLLLCNAVVGIQKVTTSCGWGCSHTLALNHQLLFLADIS